MSIGSVKYCYRGFIVGLCLFIGGCVGSCDMACIYLLGTATNARVTGFSRCENDAEHLRYVKYAWRSADGREMQGYDKVEIAWRPPRNGMVKICYLPNANVRGMIYKSQLVENSQDPSVLMLIAGLVFVLVFGAWSFVELKRSYPVS